MDGHGSAWHAKSPLLVGGDTSGHDFRLLSMAKDAEYVTRDGTPVIATLLRGDPVIVVDGISLRYVAPNSTIGIHRHAQTQLREWHTPVRGSGWVVEYREQDPSSEVGRHELQLGQSHPHLYRIEDGNVRYPWHESRPRGAPFVSFEDLVAKTT